MTINRVVTLTLLTLSLACLAAAQTVTYSIPPGQVVVEPNGTVINEGGSICINGSSALLLGYESCTMIAGHRTGPLALQGSDGSTGQIYVGTRFIVNNTVEEICTNTALWNRVLLPSGSYEITMDCTMSRNGSLGAPENQYHLDWIAHLQSYKVCTRNGGCVNGTEWVGDSGTVTLTPITQ